MMDYIYTKFRDSNICSLEDRYYGGLKTPVQIGLMVLKIFAHILDKKIIFYDITFL